MKFLFIGAYLRDEDTPGQYSTTTAHIRTHGHTDTRTPRFLDAGAPGYEIVCVDDANCMEVCVNNDNVNGF